MLIMIYGRVSDAETARQQLEAVRGILPEDAYNLLSGQLARVSNAGGGRLGFGLLFSFVLAAWSASRAVDALMTAMNGAYGEEEAHNVFTRNLVSLALTRGGLIFFAHSIAAISPLPPALTTESHCVGKRGSRTL